MASWLAVSTVKLPEICALPPRIGSLMLGADSTLPSRMIANGLLTFSVRQLGELGAALLVECDR